MGQDVNQDYYVENPDFSNGLGVDKEIADTLKCVKDINVYEVRINEKGLPSICMETPIYHVRFSRNVYNDVNFDPNSCDADIVCIPSCYAYYSAVLSDVKKALLMAKAQYEYYRSVRRERLMTSWSNPNVEKPTAALVDSMIDIKSGNKFLLGIVNDIEAFYEKLKGWTQSLYMKQAILIEYLKNRRTEASAYKKIQ